MFVGIFFSLMLARILFNIVNLASTKRMFYFSSRCSRVRLAAVLEQPGAIDKSKQELNSMLSSLHHFVLPVLSTHFVEDCK